MLIVIVTRPDSRSWASFGCGSEIISAGDPIVSIAQSARTFGDLYLYSQIAGIAIE
jgi:hypothetical protein